MKNFKINTVASIAVCAMLATGLSSCVEAGVTSKKLNGDEQNLPDELKGLKIYRVSTGGGNYVKVAVLDDKINSTTYQVGKYQESIVIVNRQTDRAIEVSQVLLENDSLIVCRK